jgi:lipopolysaccharide export system protein LptC
MAEPRQEPLSQAEAEQATKAAVEAAAAAERARAVARMRTASDFGTADRRVLEQTAQRSRIVNVLKIALPLAAIGLVGTLAMYSLVYKPERAIAISYASRGTEESTIVMNGARFVGTDKKNEPFELLANKTRQNPDEPALVELTALKARLTLSNGLGLTLAADAGKLDTANRILVLTGPTTLTSTDGYKITTSEARADLKAGLVTGQHPVRAEGPFGSLSANGFEADRNARTIVFTGRVEMQFLPGAEQK